MFTEFGLKPHFYLYIAAFVVMILYMGYAFWYEHKSRMMGDLESLFKKEGLTDAQIDNIKHDDDVWYYKDKSTCIGYSSDERDPCPKFQSVCLGDTTYGSIDQQVQEVSNLIKKGLNAHPLCPLIYEGSD